MNRNDATDVKKWIKRLERVLKDIPEGVTLYGMDSELLVVDQAKYAHHRDTYEGPVPFLGTFTADNEDAMTTIRSGRAYTDSGGW